MNGLLITALVPLDLDWFLLSGAPQGLQVVLVHAQRRQLPLPAGAEGGRAALHHN